MKDWDYPFARPHSWDWRDEQWYVRYLELKKYKEEFGHCRVPKAWANNPALARWVSSQRRKKKQMVSWRRELLDKLDFTWRINPLLKVPPKPWSQHYQALLAFKKRFGHVNVPSDWPEDKRLAKWVKIQRGDHKKGLLALEKVQQLEAIGFVWVLQVQVVLPWETYYEHLLAFREKHNHCNVPSTYEDKKLARWVARQRKIVVSMPENRKQLLNDIGFTWQLREKRLSWDERYQELLTFKSKKGHCNTSRYGIKGLGGWVKQQRNKYRLNLLTQEQVQKLEKIGFSWSIRQDAWEAHYQQLVTFYQTYGHCQVKFEPSASQTLKHWVARQFQVKNSLSKNQIAKLDRLNFWKKNTIQTKKELKWHIHYQKLVVFQQTYGHCNVPRSKYDQLACWVSVQRQTFKKGMLTTKRIDLLEALGFEWSRKGKDLHQIVHDEKWFAKFVQLKDFYQQHGHFKVPSKNSPGKVLGKWVADQRYRYKQGKLSQKRVDLLNSIDFEWYPPVNKAQQKKAKTNKSKKK